MAAKFDLTRLPSLPAALAVLGNKNNYAAIGGVNKIADSFGTICSLPAIDDVARILVTHPSEGAQYSLFRQAFNLEDEASATDFIESMDQDITGPEFLQKLVIGRMAGINNAVVARIDSVVCESGQFQYAGLGLITLSTNADPLTIPKAGEPGDEDSQPYRAIMLTWRPHMQSYARLIQPEAITYFNEGKPHATAYILTMARHFAGNLKAMIEEQWKNIPVPSRDALFVLKHELNNTVPEDIKIDWPEHWDLPNYLEPYAPEGAK